MYIVSELGVIELYGSVCKELVVCVLINFFLGDKNCVIWIVDVKKFYIIYYWCRIFLKVDDLCICDFFEEDNC